ASLHPNKRGGSFRDRISGTPAFNALSRSSLLAGPHPQEPGRVVVVRAKGNYSVEPDAFEFRIGSKTLRVDGRTITTTRITHTRESGLRRDDLLEQTSRHREDSLAGQARAILSELFADSAKRPAREVLDELREVYGLEPRVVQRARDELGLETWQEG